MKLKIKYMTKFIKCSCENTEYKGCSIKNEPININLVTSVKKTTTRYYPDNE